MKAFITAAGITILGIFLVEISLSNAHHHRPGHNCSDRERPPINTTEVTCDKIQKPSEFFKVRACATKCRHCYNSTELNQVPACLVQKKCQCLAKGNAGGNSTTTTTTTTPSSGETNSTTTPSTNTSTSNPSTSDSSGSSPSQTTQNSSTTTTVGSSST